MLEKILDDPVASVLVSALLGLGLAALFRRACDGRGGRQCVIVKGPKIEDVNKYYYKVDGQCYKYTPYVTSCDSRGRVQQQTPLNSYESPAKTL